MVGRYIGVGNCNAWNRLPGRANPRPTGTPDFPSPTGGGGGFEHPRLSRLLLVVEKNGKSVRKLVKNDYETISVNFFASQNCGPQGQQMTKFSSFFAFVKHRFGKALLSRERL